MKAVKGRVTHFCGTCLDICSLPRILPRRVEFRSLIMQPLEWFYGTAWLIVERHSVVAASGLTGLAENIALFFIQFGVPLTPSTSFPVQSTMIRRLKNWTVLSRLHHIPFQGFSFLIGIKWLLDFSMNSPVTAPEGRRVSLPFPCHHGSFLK